jgi:hypothetical protein
MEKRYIEATQEAGIALFSRKISGEVIMLNLLRFRKVADYSKNPDLAPRKQISGREAYQKYLDHTLPFLKESGGSIAFIGEGGAYLIGPQDEQWDMALLIRQKSVSDFVAFASNQEYLTGIGHRTAALDDSRLLPLVEMSIPA